MSTDGGLDVGRLARTLTLIVFVTTVFLFIAAERLSGDLFRIGAVAIGAVGIVTAIVGFLIAVSTYFPDEESP